MSTPSESRDIRNCRLFARAASAATMLVGTLGLLGWLLGIPALTGAFPGLVAMQPNAALCFVLAGLSLWLIQLRQGEPGIPRIRLRAGQVLSGAVALMGLLTLAESLFHWKLGIDEVLFHRSLLATGVLHPGRMPAATALGFSLLAVSMALVTTRRFYLAQSLSVFTALNGFVACVGYLLGVRSLYSIVPYSPVALQTALLFVVMGLAILALRPTLGLMATLTSKYIGGVLARRGLPLVVGLPILFGWVRWRGEFAGLYGTEFGVAVHALSEVVAFSVLLWVSAMWLNRVDQERRDAKRRNYDLAAIVASYDETIFSKDMSGTIISWNPNAEALYGYKAEEIVGKPVSTIIPPELREEAKQFLQETAAGRLVTHEETVRRHKDGRLIHVSLILSPVRDPEGRIVGASTIAHDITARKRTEKTLREYERVVEGLEEMIVVVDREYRYVIANRAFLHYRCMEREQVIGRLVEEVVTREIFEPLVKGKMDECFRGKIVQYEFRHEYPKLGERDFFVSYFPIESFTGIDRIACVLQDITERKRAQEELRKSEERFSKAFRSCPLPMAISTEGDGRYLDVNEAFLQMLGYERKDMIGRTASDLGIWAQPSLRLEMIQQLAESGRVTGFHTQYTTAAGQIREADVSAERIDLDGQPCIMAITRDITETRRLEAQFRQAQKMEAVGRLAGGVAHDFNNMLGVIIGYSDLSLGLVEPESLLNRYLVQIKKASNRAVLLTRQLLAFSRRQVVFPKILDLNEVVGSVMSLLLRMVSEDIAVSFRPTVPIDCIKADPGQIEQILMNLVVNARDAMPSGGEIVIATGHAEVDELYASQHPDSQIGKHVVLTVSDTGCGMNEATKSQIFEPFFTTKGVGLGTGLGLSTVDGIVKQNGGNIWVYSELGKGTTFKIHFPRVAEKADPLVHHDEAAEFPGGSETILVVEDDKPLRELVVRMLQEAGYRVLEAKSAEAALVIVQTPEPAIDLLLTDLIMPGKSGIDLVEQIKTVRPDIRSLFMSGYTADLAALRDVLMPEAAFLEKPFTRSSLLVKVHSALHGVSATQPQSSPSSDNRLSRGQGG